MIGSIGNNLGNNLRFPEQSKSVSVVSRNISLNSPMIDRIHKAKPGCSACGKKVA
jgi:hypothetical protein